MTRLAWKTRLFMAGAMALALAACNDNRPASGAATPSALAVLDPSAGLLPPAPPAPVARYEPAQGYRLAERAYGVQRAVYDAPPDYGFAYGEEEPWAWETADDWSMYAEPWDDGYRYYYYQPGADYPYFVRDDDYGYGYDRGGALVVVVDAAGRYLPVQEYRRVAPIAGRYYAHGRDLRRVAQRAQRIQVDERTWTARAPRVTKGADRWLAAAREDNAWRQWRENDRNRELDRFTAEQLRRAEAQRARIAQRDRGEDLRRDRDQGRLAELRLQQDQAQAQRQQRDALEAQIRDERGRHPQAEAQQREQRQAQAEAARNRQAQAERASVQQRQRADAERQQRDAREAQAREARGRQQAEARQQQQARQAQAAHERQAQARADQARERQQAQTAQREQAQAQRAQQAEAQRAQHEQAQAQRAQQANAQRAQRDQARAADQQARAAAAHERAAPRSQDHPRPNGKPEGRGKDKDKKD